MLDLGDRVTQFLDSFHLLTKELSLDEITEMSISFAVTGLVEIKKTLVDCFFQLKSSLHGLKWSAPLHAARLGNILEDDTSSSLGLVPINFIPWSRSSLELFLKKEENPGRAW